MDGIIVIFAPACLVNNKTDVVQQYNSASKHTHTHAHIHTPIIIIIIVQSIMSIFISVCILMIEHNYL